jgi:hypothetical protein
MTKIEREKNIATAMALAHIMGQSLGKQEFSKMNFKIAQHHICELAGPDPDNRIKKILNKLIRGEV